ncbi:hypothetical protein VO226_15385 [Halomonas elongata]|uniref:hypothetical protein n=1 Tax=Halomonas elongata TaxID=2746 RepID=UPI002E2BF43E|nr:hypothetical protein [Halomonas elongata]WVI71287.1 hypothetical protein VO226_15385 [Halomonas elongata]
MTDWLAPLPNDTQQLVLDEVAGRVDAGHCRSPVGLLRSLATRACQGEFNATQFAQHYAALTEKGKAAREEVRALVGRVRRP